MDDATLSKRWEAIGRGDIVTTPDAHLAQSTYYKPLSDAVDEFVHWAQTPGERLVGFSDAWCRPVRDVARERLQP